jgi:hypothetical protein
MPDRIHCQFDGARNLWQGLADCRRYAMILAINDA